VAIAHRVWPSSPLSVALILLIILFTHDILGMALSISGYAGVGLWEGIKSVVGDNFDWFRLLLPLAAGICASFLFKHLTNRSTRDRANRAAP
jgi:hypothetical protein